MARTGFVTGKPSRSGTSFRHRTLRHCRKLFTDCRNSTPISCLARELSENPGCYPTSVILGLKPLVESGVDRCGARNYLRLQVGRYWRGQRAQERNAIVEVNENFRAYNLFKHRHTPEVADHLGPEADGICFHNPFASGRSRNSLDAVRGCIPAKADEIEALYRQFYAGRPMVRILRREICRNCGIWRIRIFAISGSRSTLRASV